MSAIGKKIPNMKLEVDGDKALDLPKDLMGKWTLLYIYPKDDTPGCTKQACGYRENIGQFKKIGVQVYGLSGDDLKSHEAFRQKFDLNFPLISDKNKTLATFLESYGEQERNGVKSMGLSRDSFLIDPDGVVKQEWRKVDPTTTVQSTFDEAQKFVL